MQVGEDNAGRGGECRWRRWVQVGEGNAVQVGEGSAGRGGECR